METVFEGLANMQQEVERFKKEVRGDLDQMGGRIAFGIILWELFTQRKPYADLTGPALIQSILNGQREEIPHDDGDKALLLVASGGG